MLRRGSGLVPWIPLVGVGVFIAMYATATPLTDEWNLMRGAMRMSHARTLTEMWDSLVWYSYSHCVIVPFVCFYLPIEFLTGFDSRALMALTVLCHGSMLFTLARRYKPPPLVLFCFGLVLFSPARYIELLWGFEFTIAMSIAFPVWALYVLQGIEPQRGNAHVAKRVVCAWTLLALGVLSSAGGYLGFPAACVVLVLGPLHSRAKLALLALFAASGFGMYYATIQLQSEFAFGERHVLQIATCAGAALLGAPAAIETFSLDGLAILGFTVLALAAVAAVRALRAGLAREAAFAVGLICYGVSAVAVIAVNRPYLANWHIEFILPSMVGGLALSWLLWNRGRKWFDGIVCAGLVAASLAGVQGWHYGFATGGPEFQAYARQIERYIVTFDRDPGQPIPFPPMGPWSINHEMTAFLRNVEHPVFEHADISRQ